MSLAMRERFARTTVELVEQDLSVAVVLAEISVSYFEKAMADHPDRVINVGIREQLAVSVGAGLALSGLRPIVHTIAPFLVERSFEQIKLGFNHQDVGGVLVSVGASYDISGGGRTHQSPGDVALLDTLPDWTIHVPGHEDEVEALLRDAVQGEGRAYVRLTTGGNRVRCQSGGQRSCGVRAAGPCWRSARCWTTSWRRLKGSTSRSSTPRPFGRSMPRRWWRRWGVPMWRWWSRMPWGPPRGRSTRPWPTSRIAR